MPHKRFTEQECLDAIRRFLNDTDELFGRRWTGYGMSTTTVVNHMDRGPWSELITDMALEYAPIDRVYRWPLCPKRRKHTSLELFRGTKIAWAQSGCATCERQEASREAWRAGLPTFGQQYPDLVEYLDQPDDAHSRGEMVTFRCADCGRGGIRWSPRAGGSPRCTRCVATDGRPVGDTVPRRGGGDPAHIERKVAEALSILGVVAAADLGIVVPEGNYPQDVIKPDLVIQPIRVAIEIDLGSHSVYHRNRHMTEAGERDDANRDQLLASLGWWVLRVREPSAPTQGDWPWRVETTSSSASKIAALIASALSHSEANVPPRELPP